MTPIVSQSQTKFISAAIEQLRSFCQVNLQSNWLYRESDEMKADLDILELSAAAGDIDLKYLDESGFCAWSEPGYLVSKFIKLVVPGVRIYLWCC